MLFPEKHFYPTHTINQLQTKQPLSNKDVLLPPSCWHTHTRTLQTNLRHTLSHTPLGFSYSRVFCLSPSVPGGLKSNEAEEEGSERRERVFLLMEGPSSVSSLCRWTCCCTSGHMPREQRRQSSVVGCWWGGMRWMTSTCVHVFDP